MPRLAPATPSENGVLLPSPCQSIDPGSRRDPTRTNRQHQHVGPKRLPHPTNSSLIAGDTPRSVLSTRIQQHPARCSCMVGPFSCVRRDQIRPRTSPHSHCRRGGAGHDQPPSKDRPHRVARRSGAGTPRHEFLAGRYGSRNLRGRHQAQGWPVAIPRSNGRGQHHAASASLAVG